jgi:hypothetical protein
MKLRAVAAMLDGGRLLLARGVRVDGKLRIEAASRVLLPSDEGPDPDLRHELARSGMLGHPTVLVVPSERAFLCFHRPQVRDEGALHETIRYEVEPELPLPAEDLLVDCESRFGDGGHRKSLVAAVPARDVFGEAEQLRRLGISPTHVTVRAAALAGSYAAAGLTNGHGRAIGLHGAVGGLDVVRLGEGRLEGLRAIPLPEGEEHGHLPDLALSPLAEAAILGELSAAYVSGQVSATNGVSGQLRDSLGLSPSNVSVESVADGLSEEETQLLSGPAFPLIGALGQLLGYPSAPDIDLADTRERRRSWLAHCRLPLRIAAALLLLLAVLWTASGMAARSGLDTRRQRADESLAVLWQQVHPDKPLPVDPVRSLRAGLFASGRGSGGGPHHVLSTLARVTSVLGEEGDVPYRHIAIAGHTVTVHGAAPDYAAVDALLRRLERDAGFAVGQPRMTREPGGVSFRVELEDADAD